MTRLREGRAELVKWLEDNERFEFLWVYEDDLNKLRRTKEAVLSTQKFLEVINSEYKVLKRKFRSVGFGDTATDECVVEAIYDAIH